ncbi:juvenile hormone esterase-like isoform X1 [Lucilia cuprina]|uniref:juvenile hormone esterase-like isoform X1 n=2 Tax=Lucilia cuprina TaxID=7375 RepID=UPI001F0638E4|nr:juvenile hormone esterase-like isoform X1 [Lucilia cuprina]
MFKFKEILTEDFKAGLKDFLDYNQKRQRLHYRKIIDMTLKLLFMLIMPLAYTVVSQFLESRFTSTVCSDKAGCMRGRLMRGYNTPLFEAFMGIPYALPPLGELRFSSPKEFPKWENTLNAFEAKPDCIQKNYLLPTYPVSGSEDCLYLNVYRPLHHHNTHKLPVMIYIHGGGWFSGTANPAITGPEYIMDTEQVILVTFSYRLGALGFLSTGDANIPGNFGLKDQLLAMKWVQNNIAAFGGDQEKVTIFGQSVGGVSAHMHMLSPQAEGLFQGVIALSGTANVPFAINDHPLEQALRTAELCGIENATNLSTKELLNSLRAVDVDILIRAGDGLKFWSVDHITNYRPVIESSDIKDAFLTRHPEDILRSGDYKPVPFMLGTVPKEGAVRVAAIMESQELKESFNKDFYNILQKFLDFPTHLEGKQLASKMKRIIQEYFKGEEELNDNTRQGFLDLVTERGFHHPYYNAIKNYINTIDTKSYPIYLYSFNYSGPYSYSTLYTGGLSSLDYGVVHCDDLIYLFRSPLLFPDFPKDSRHAKVLQLFVGNFVHFAKYREPRSSPPLKRCNKSTFQRKPDTICDYQLFENGNLESSTNILKTDNKFNVEHMKFWDDILRE